VKKPENSNLRRSKEWILLNELKTKDGDCVNEAPSRSRTVTVEVASESCVRGKKPVNKPRARAIALYLPQFHPTIENDDWWGKGFTEWTNVANAKPLFSRHYQPHIPADLGFYDLRVEETRLQQAELARKFGIEAFCYYHYWFAGRRMLNRPFDDVVSSGRPNFPFCLCWANETWSGVWHGAPERILIEQTYPGIADYQAHFDALLPAFRDCRYLRVDDKPVFLIYKPLDLPDAQILIDLWRTMAEQAGLGGIYLIGISGDPNRDLTTLGFDAVANTPLVSKLLSVSKPGSLEWLRQKLNHKLGRPHLLEFSDFEKQHTPSKITAYEAYPTVVHAWDNTPRSGINGIAYRNPDPEIFRNLLNAALASVIDKPLEHRLIFLKSWNEWAEGNHLEPDLKYGDAYLRVISDVLVSTYNDCD
jgi:lipopolysaccharide biosynthesis protein